jgi:hypothetical protein
MQRRLLAIRNVVPMHIARIARPVMEWTVTAEIRPARSWMDHFLLW